MNDPEWFPAVVAELARQRCDAEGWARYGARLTELVTDTLGAHIPQHHSLEHGLAVQISLADDRIGAVAVHLRRRDESRWFVEALADAGPEPVPATLASVLAANVAPYAAGLVCTRAPARLVARAANPAETLDESELLRLVWDCAAVATEWSAGRSQEARP